MSSTENESGPFVAFFLPAVVGCLTILLARRWASTQVSNTSTAVSRRRKIIKDPLIKRPLPTLSCKMVAPGSKKSGVAKKGASVCDDDINGGKRFNRSRLSTAAPSAVNNGKSDILQPPKHIPFPCIPQDGELLFETMSFVFYLVATGLQFLNLYRTAWWLPSSLDNQTVHFYLIDPHLVAFIVTILSRRFLFSMTLALLRMFVSAKLMPQATVAAKMFILGVLYGALAYCAFFLLLKYSLLRIFFLLYPSALYVLMFGFNAAPLLTLRRGSAPPHCCSHEPGATRVEVETLRRDFNARFERVLFNSVLAAYYSSFVPCCFVQPHVYYEVMPAAQQVCLVWGALCARYTAQLVPASVVDTCHRAALHLGRWEHASPYHSGGSEVTTWSAGRFYRLGARVRYSGATYVAVAPVVAAAPGDVMQFRYHNVFVNPATMLCLLLCLQLALVVLQLFLLFGSLAWNNFFSIIILLFINYYTLFKMTRDYFIAWRVYKAESFIMDKNGMQIPVN